MDEEIFEGQEEKLNRGKFGNMRSFSITAQSKYKDKHKPRLRIFASSTLSAHLMKGAPGWCVTTF
jgi:hypothetical protein